MKETIILSVGGSMIVPNEGIDTSFLKHLNTFIRRNISPSRRFFIVAGGGSTARRYIDAGKDVIKKITNEDLDWLGIHSTRLNAHLLRTIFRDIAHPRIVENYDHKLLNVKEPVVIGGGWKPGWSTDYCAVMFAKDYGANAVINMSNIYNVYTKDPNQFKDAKIIEKTTWDFYETLIGDKWVPGLSAPFDPVASQLAKRNKLTVIVTKGDDFANLQRVVDGQTFKGTVIKPYEISYSYYDRPYYLGEKGEYRYLNKVGIVRQTLKTLATWYRALYIKWQFNPKTLLDVGCGTGELVRMLRQMGVDAKGLEISKEAIDLSDKAVRPFLQYGDVTKKTSITDGAYDMVVSFDVLNHIERQDMKHVVAECARIARRMVLHKIYTRENSLYEFFHTPDPSHVSVMTQGFWDRIFAVIPHVTVARKFFQLPQFVETIYLLKKE
ncbi:MAG: UMP kinase [Patescibacteria group bacterium]|jgi:uridylate kinase